MNEYPEDLMPLLAEIKDLGCCNMFALSCIVDVLHEIGEEEIAEWLKENEANYLTILSQFSKWLKDNDLPSEEESLAYRVARETGLEVVAE